MSDRLESPFLGLKAGEQIAYHPWAAASARFDSDPTRCGSLYCSHQSIRPSLRWATAASTSIESMGFSERNREGSGPSIVAVELVVTSARPSEMAV